MCTRDKEFTIRGIEDCLARGYDRTGFFEVDTGEQPSWTVQLTDIAEQSPGSRCSRASRWCRHTPTRSSDPVREARTDETSAPDQDRRHARPGSSDRDVIAQPVSTPAPTSSASI